MPSREYSRTWPAVALAVTGLVFAALAPWAMVARSTVPIALDGAVTNIEVRQEKHPGVDDVWMVSMDGGRPRHLDREVAELLQVGDKVAKARWSSTLRINGRARSVGISDDARNMLVLAPALALIIGGLAFAGAHRGRRPAPRLAGPHRRRAQSRQSP